MHVTKHTISITTAADGSSTDYCTDRANGRILAVRYTKTDFADTVDMTLTTEDGSPILTLANQTASGLWYPLAQAHDAADGSALTLDGTRKLVVPIVVSNERIKCVTAQGGDTKTGQIDVLVG